MYQLKSKKTNPRSKNLRGFYIDAQSINNNVLSDHAL